MRAGSRAWVTMCACGWTISPTPPAPRGSRRCVQRLGSRLGRRLHRRRHPPVVRHPQLRPAPGRRLLPRGRRGAGPPGGRPRPVRPCRARPQRGRRRLAGLGRGRRRHRRRSSSGSDAAPPTGTADGPTASTCAGSRSASTTCPRTRSCRSSPSGSATPCTTRAAGGSAIAPVSRSRSPVTSRPSTPTSARRHRQPLDEVDVRWLSPFDGDTGVVAALFDTPRGEVRID